MAHLLLRSPELAHRGLRRVLGVAMTIAALAALFSLICEYGFHVPPVSLQWLHALQIAILVYFLVDKLIRFLTSSSRRAYLKHIWPHFALMGLVALGIFLVSRLGYSFPAAGRVYITIVQACILILLGLNLLQFNIRLSESGLPPARILIISFLVVIICGAGLLQLPRALPAPTEENPDAPNTSITIADSLFTAVSATCVTGLVVRDTGRDFSLFGQIVILAMIQLGALGIMMFGTTFALMIGRTMGLREGTFYQGLLSEGILGKIGRM
jgi:trk system potassium uptake protein TrkH